MSIGFLRRHQKRIFWPLAIIIIITFVFWGAGSALMKRRGGSSYAEIDGRAISAEEMAAARRALAHLTFRPVADGDMFRWIISTNAARDFGMGASTSEIRDYLQERMKRHLGEKFTHKDYVDHLAEMNFTETQLTGLAGDHLMQTKMVHLLDESSAVTSEELYLHYCWNKDMLTIRHVDFPSKDYREGVAEPDEAEILTYHAEGVRKGYEGAPELFRPPTAEIRYVFASYEDLEAKVEATEEKLKAHYEKTKHRYHAEPEPKEEEPKEEAKEEDAPKAPEDAEAGDAKAAEDAVAAEAPAEAAPAEAEAEAPAEGEAAAEEGEHEEGEADGHPAHKPFEKVRVEVEKDYRETNAKAKARELMGELTTRLNADGADAEKIAGESGLALAKAGPFTYEDTKELEPFGKAGGLGAEIFYGMKDPERGAAPKWSDPVHTKKGSLVFELLELKEAEELELAACREKIIEKLVTRRAAGAAADAAKEARKAIRDGSFDQARMQETGPLQASDPAVKPFRDKPVGEVSQVYKAPVDDPDAAAGPTYRVAILSDRASPSRKAFADDEEWRLGYIPRYTRSIFILSGWRQQMVRRAKFEFHGKKR